MVRGLAVVLAVVAGGVAGACGEGNPAASGDFGYEPLPGGNVVVGVPPRGVGPVAPGAEADAGTTTATLEAGTAFGIVASGVPGGAGLGTTGTGDQTGIGAVNEPSIPAAAGLGADGTGIGNVGEPTVDAGTSSVIVVF